MSNTLLLVDGENLLHRSFHKFEKFTSSDGTKTGAIYGFFKTLNSNIFRFSVSSVIVVFDNGRSKYRTSIHPEYKGGRPVRLGMDYEALQNQKREIRKILKYLNIPVIYDKRKLNNYECDDYIGLVSKLNKGKILILSSDKDFNQLIDNRVKVINPSKDAVISEHNCKQLFGYTAKECVDYLSLVGDSSDNIPGIKGMGEKRARVFLDKYGSLEKYIALEANEFSQTIDKEKVQFLKDLIDINWFIEAHPIKMSQIPIKYGKTILHNKLMDTFNKYSLVSLKSNEFLEPFKKLKPWVIK